MLPNSASNLLLTQKTYPSLLIPYYNPPIDPMKRRIMSRMDGWATVLVGKAAVVFWEMIPHGKSQRTGWTYPKGRQINLRNHRKTPTGYAKRVTTKLHKARNAYPVFQLFSACMKMWEAFACSNRAQVSVRGEASYANDKRV